MKDNKVHEQRQQKVSKTESLRISEQETSSKKQEAPLDPPKKNRAPVNDQCLDQQCPTHFEFLKSLRVLEESIIVCFFRLSTIKQEPKEEIFELIKEDVFSCLDYHRRTAHKHTQYLKTLEQSKNLTQKGKK